MALKAGRVGIDPKYVDATGKPVIGPDPGPTPSVDTVEWVKVADNTTTFEWVYENTVPYLVAATSGGDICLFMTTCNGGSVQSPRIQTTGNAPNLSFSRSGDKIVGESSKAAHVYVLMKAPVSSSKAATTRKTAKKTAK